MFRTNNIIEPPIVVFKKKLIGLCDKKHLIDLSQAVPSYPMPEKIKNELVNNFSNSFSFYSPDQGSKELIDAVCSLHSVNGLKIDPAQVLISAGANQGAFSIFTTLFKAGDKVALPVPYYFNYDMALKMLGVEPVYYFLEEEQGFNFIFKDFDKSILDKCKGIIVVNPSNPTGAESDIEELKQLYSECVKKDVTLICDEAYGFFSQKGYPASSLLNAVNSVNKLVIINTFSKTFSLTGFRVGYTIADAKIINELLKVQDTVIICAPTISQIAALTGLNSCSEWLNEKIKFVQNNVKEFKKLFATANTKYKLASCGNFFAYLKHPYQDKTAQEACFVLAEQANIMTLPGPIFGPKQERFIRLAFGNLQGKDQILQLVERLKG